jgi:hypothetical protein
LTRVTVETRTQKIVFFVSFEFREVNLARKNCQAVIESTRD